MPSATLTSKGQLTIPKKVRDQLHLKSGDRVNFIVLNDGNVLLQPAIIRVTELKGVLYKKGRRPISIEEMNAAVSKRMSAKK